MKNIHTMKFTKTVLKNLVSKPVTTTYPEVPREYHERTRGHISIDIDTCILCGMCSRKCPTGAITVDRAAKTWSIERFGCIQCGCCVENCPKKCLTMENTYTTPGGQKRSDSFLKTNMPTPPPRPARPAAKPAAGAASKPAAGAPTKPAASAPAVQKAVPGKADTAADTAAKPETAPVAKPADAAAAQTASATEGSK